MEALRRGGLRGKKLSQRYVNKYGVTTVMYVECTALRKKEIELVFTRNFGCFSCTGTMYLCYLARTPFLLMVYCFCSLQKLSYIKYIFGKLSGRIIRSHDYRALLIPPCTGLFMHRVINTLIPTMSEKPEVTDCAQFWLISTPEFLLHTGRV